ncbi:MAG: hypothetical protein LBB65_06015 [Burkholderiales bacterium]|jgi:hypothetical protein|nr:hypothetical protein [Burkholderiales bacterium]
MSTSSRISRQKIEARALEPFKAAANERGLPFHHGQGHENRLPIRRNVYFQFGDLRVEMPGVTVIVEVESGGGITNLVKYWEAIASQRLNKPVRLLHLFRQTSENDYAAHIKIWKFLFPLMKESLGEMFDGACMAYREGAPESLEPAVSLFKQWLQENV